VIPDECAVISTRGSSPSGELEDSGSIGRNQPTRDLARKHRRSAADHQPRPAQRARDLVAHTVGDRVLNGPMARRFAEIEMALGGKIPDGLIFRISSIDNDPAQKFTADMMASVKPNARRKLSGLAPAAGT
jgi:hypothetical protein